ncbi:TPA: hypothetical protein RNS57_003009 [Stenotrophomonas maltophilia]|uniref:hypothetical protein n=1 Tax=Stenotrophomonas maltophilia TaxID=40324 RepID=UPI0013DCC537|nr:hypothetical protein [Stenotrophomonas maltophilia]EJE6497548.1 hypothetical protein [Salmonella enterica]MCU1182932.1 hypothetical protein [Stenotrophomonas maltophilia]HDS1087943.1 hypothetical protein [Stenotrophomonas maltophilia]HDX0793977.1 hypothetical protein [Stenotrophomonas maltophilia]HDX0798926.1 hypothetical protein [Stenotrophomonas maltophilia]
MNSAVIAFAAAGFVATSLIFFIIELLGDSREHEISILLSILLGGIIIFTPARDVAIKTLGDLASNTAGLIWSVVFLIVWTLGSACAYGLLKKLRT